MEYLIFTTILFTIITIYQLIKYSKSDYTDLDWYLHAETYIFITIIVHLTLFLYSVGFFVGLIYIGGTGVAKLLNGFNYGI